jgi:archaeosine synthase
MLVKEKGLISLTLDGGKILFETKTNIVEISDDFELKGSVFAPGIKKADKNIRIGDEVIVTRKNKLIAVGSSLMTGKEMEKLNYGEAVKIRHIKKN